MLFAAVIGIITPLAAILGPFRAVEESILSGMISGEARSDVMAWYVTTATFGSAVGTRNRRQDRPWAGEEWLVRHRGLPRTIWPLRGHGRGQYRMRRFVERTHRIGGVQKEYVPWDTIDETDPDTTVAPRRPNQRF